MNITISLTKEVLKELDNQAKQLSRTRSSHIKELTLQGILYMIFKIGDDYEMHKLADVKEYDDESLSLVLINGQEISYEIRYLTPRTYIESKQLIEVLKR